MLDPKITQSLKIRELVTELKTHMEELNYRPHTIVDANCVFKKLTDYCETNNDGIFTKELCAKFVWDCYGIAIGDKSRGKWVNTALKKIVDFQKFGKIFTRPSVSVQKDFSPENKSLFEGVLGNYRTYAAESSIRKYHVFLLRFETFLKDRGVIYFNQLELHHVNAFIETLEGAARNTVRAAAGNLRKLFGYAFENGYHHTDFSNVLPTVTYSMHRRLPETFTPEQIELILENIDRCNPVGKRNYAVLLLVARLGLRISDVFGLCYDSINWQTKELTITQQKTGVFLKLPLPEEAGWAIIQYLKHSRPISPCENIFIRHSAPYDKLKGDFTKIISDAIQKAGVKTAHNRSKGTHTLRYSIASSMLGNGNTVCEISQILGHTDSRTSEQYIRLNADILRQCALEVTV